MRQKLNKTETKQSCMDNIERMMCNSLNMHSDQNNSALVFKPELS